MLMVTLLILLRMIIRFQYRGNTKMYRSLLSLHICYIGSESGNDLIWTYLMPWLVRGKLVPTKHNEHPFWNKGSSGPVRE